MTDDTTRNPEVDNFFYIQLLLESFNKLGRLDLAVESIDQRLPTELFRLVDRTNTEIDQRHRNSIRTASKTRQAMHRMDAEDSDIRETIISDLLTTLYSKFEAIAEGHRVFHDVIEGILKRERVSDTTSLTGGFNELWKLYQNEVRLKLARQILLSYDVRYVPFSTITLPPKYTMHFARGKRNQVWEMFSGVGQGINPR